MYPPQGPRPVSPGPKLEGELLEELLHPGVLDIFDADAVDSGGTLVGSHVPPRPSHHVAAGDLVEQGVETTLGCLLGTAVEHALEGSNAVRADTGPADGASRHSSALLPSTIVHR
jgi:hypothetical protein